jgi:hypothetical protein
VIPGLGDENRRVPLPAITSGTPCDVRQAPLKLASGMR